MMQVLLAISMVSVVWGSAPMSRDYKDAYQRSLENGKPLLVVVGADWCPACVTLKKQVIERLEREGALGPVELSFVDKDDEPTLAGRLMRGQSLPEIILYTKTAEGWKRKQLNGLQSQSTLRSLIRTAAPAPTPSETASSD